MRNPYFHHNIMFSDEAMFSTNGTVSSQHVRYWSDVNPHFRILNKRQYFVKVNVWCTIAYFFEDNVNQHTYLDMLPNFLSDALDDLPLDYRQLMYFQQDGCPAHFSRIVVN